MVHMLRAPTMHQAHDKLASRLLYAHRDKLDQGGNQHMSLNHVYVEAKSMVWDHELRRLWVPESRWRTMIRQYIDPAEVERWLAVIDVREAKNKRGGSYVFRMNPVYPRPGGRGTVRSMGGCMLTLSIVFSPVPRVLLHSRTCYVGYLSGLDLSVAYHLTRLTATQQGMAPEDFLFDWFLESAQFHPFRTLAFPLGSEDEYERFLERPRGPEYPAMYNAHKHHEKFLTQDDEGVLYSGMPFTSYRRVRKRWHSEMFGIEHAQQFADASTGKSDHRAYAPLPAVHVRDLTFNAIGLN